ncbi:MAG: methylase [Acidimicrobiales bacterium]|nr:methylase [Acidimicrobiales bacterium]
MGSDSPLYGEPLPSARTGALYNAFSYPTKIDAESVALFIASHTRPGDTVLDPFGGSGATGIAVMLCDRPTEGMRRRAAALGMEPVWGPRSAVLYELSVIGSLLGQVMTNPPPRERFLQAASQVLRRVHRKLGWCYETVSPSGEAGEIRHVIWSEVLRCPSCGEDMLFFDLAVRRNPAKILPAGSCSSCNAAVVVAEAERRLETTVDPVTGERVLGRVRVPVWVYGSAASGNWSRRATEEDVAALARISDLSPEAWVPSSSVEWGDLYRSGYHQGISRVHHFYTRRNLLVMSELWAEVDRHPKFLGDALRLWVLSYNSSHSTLMTRVVAKSGQPDLVLTGAQSGVLYVSSLPVEKNILKGLQRKSAVFADAFSLTEGSRSAVQVLNASSTSMQLEDCSVDYVFTDPPFGGFIPYSEINFLNEAWLGRLTDTQDEAIVSPAQGKGIADYQLLLKTVFREVARVTTERAPMTVIFHSSQPAVWEAIGEAFSSNGLVVLRTSVLDKLQPSFKQVVSDGGTRGDAIFLLEHSGASRRAGAVSAGEPDPRQVSGPVAVSGDPKRLYSLYVGDCLKRGHRVVLSAPEFYAQLPAREP